jgi:hypothetical protein
MHLPVVNNGVAPLSKRFPEGDIGHKPAGEKQGRLAVLFVQEVF